jgi:iron complex outermembrane receptor protein
VTADTNVFTAGLRGNLESLGDYFKTWTWEAGLRWNEDAHTEKIGGLINNYALRAALLDTNPTTAFNPFGLNQNSPEVIDKIIITTTGVASAKLLTQDFILNGDLLQLPAGPICFALGGQYLANHFKDQPDAITAAGQVSGVGTFNATKGSRDSWAIFWETRVPITSSSWNIPGIYSLELDYAERFENFSDFGSTERPKFSIRWQPFGGSPVTLRASYIEAYHAPGLVDLFAGTAVGFPPIFDPVTNTFVRGVETLFSSNPNLQPEIAYERTFGAVLTPAIWWSALRGLTFTIDYGHIDLRALPFS